MKSLTELATESRFLAYADNLFSFPNTKASCFEVTKLLFGEALLLEAALLLMDLRQPSPLKMKGFIYLRKNFQDCMSSYFLQCKVYVVHLFKHSDLQVRVSKFPSVMLKKITLLNYTQIILFCINLF